MRKHDDMTQYEREKLERYLQSVGKSVFVEILYPELQRNMDVNYEYLANKYEIYSSFTLNSQRGRLSTSKTIFRNGWQFEALKIVRNSNAEPRIKALASEFYHDAMLREE